MRPPIRILEDGPSEQLQLCLPPRVEVKPAVLNEPKQLALFVLDRLGRWVPSLDIVNSWPIEWLTQHPGSLIRGPRYAVNFTSVQSAQFSNEVIERRPYDMPISRLIYETEPLTEPNVIPWTSEEIAGIGYANPRAVQRLELNPAPTEPGISDAMAIAQANSVRDIQESEDRIALASMQEAVATQLSRSMQQFIGTPNTPETRSSMADIGADYIRQQLRNTGFAQRILQPRVEATQDGATINFTVVTPPLRYFEASFVVSPADGSGRLTIGAEVPEADRLRGAHTEMVTLDEIQDVQIDDGNIDDLTEDAIESYDRAAQSAALEMPAPQRSSMAQMHHWTAED